jgi:hypothetical protein
MPSFTKTCQSLNSGQLTSSRPRVERIVCTMAIEEQAQRPLQAVLQQTIQG